MLIGTSVNKLAEWAGGVQSGRLVRSGYTGLTALLTAPDFGGLRPSEVSPPAGTQVEAAGKILETCRPWR